MPRDAMEWFVVAFVLIAFAWVAVNFVRDVPAHPQTACETALRASYERELATSEALVGCRVESSLAEARPGDRYQFERQGYFCLDADSSGEQLVFNQTVSLRDTWAKIARKG